MYSLGAAAQRIQIDVSRGSLSQGRRCEDKIWRQIVTIMDTLVTTAYKEAKNAFTLPGLGKLVLEIFSGRDS